MSTENWLPQKGSSQQSACPKCGAALPPEAPAGLCPKCLMQQGLETTTAHGGGSQRELAPGEQFGRYRIVRLLGRGGMGAVYEAEEIETARRVALKVLAHKLESPEHRQRFLREGRLAASVVHANSLYVYGAEEVDGTPVIAMEMAPGGTLEERIRREGPLPVGQAVDLVLQIIAGLEAAEAVGVLHRDIKPSNCFLDADGTVKIGDFGLSISTTARDQTRVTQSGVFLGTPAFSSPEQLRGDELDVRSDIYSVGVTLYYLLTGKLPFEGKQMVHLLATVLERPAPSPRDVRPEIPRGLADVVLRCLAKQPAQRFESYDQLRQALWSYRSEAPPPGTIGLRILAGGIDGILFFLISAVLPVLWARDFATWQIHHDAITQSGSPGATLELTLLSALGFIVSLMYFAILEGVWGASPGKAICRLRVMGPDREVPGVGRAGLRAAVFVGSDCLPWWVWYAVDRQSYLGWHEGDLDMAFVSWVVVPVCFLAALVPFVTMRRRNGYAGIHELVSGTRVVRRPAVERRPGVEVADEPIPEREAASRIGPYEVLGPLRSRSGEEMLLAYDRRLLRKVWIRRCAATTPAAPEARRDMSRIGRLRWLAGHRDEAGGWDAYEAPPGKPLLQLIAEPQPWAAVRFWLVDVARELRAGLEDGTVPAAVSLDRVWITADGRAKLLDFPGPGLEDGACDPEPPSVGDAADACAFLKRLAIAALEGAIVSAAEAKDRPMNCRLPLAAREALHGLGRQDREIPVAELESLAHRPATVSHQRRLGTLAACLLPPLLLAGLVGFYAAIGVRNTQQFLEAHPEVRELAGYVDFYESLSLVQSTTGAQGESDTAKLRELLSLVQSITGAQGESDTAKLREAIEIVVASEFRETIEDPAIWSNPVAKEFVSTRGQELMKTFIQKHPNPSAEDLAQARRQLETVQELIRMMSRTPEDLFRFGAKLTSFTLNLAGFLAICVVLPSWVCALLLGDSLLLRFLEIAVVNRRGAPASRLRVFLRSFVLWSSVLLGMPLAVCVMAVPVLWPISLLLVLVVILAFRSERGFHDRLAGTWLVPR